MIVVSNVQGQSQRSGYFELVILDLRRLDRHIFLTVFLLPQVDILFLIIILFIALDYHTKQVTFCQTQNFLNFSILKTNFEKFTFNDISLQFLSKYSNTRTFHVFVCQLYAKNLSHIEIFLLEQLQLSSENWVANQKQIE